jgi:hypothetical protein
VSVEATVNYLGPMTERPRYHAQDHTRDNLVLDPRRVRIDDVRGESPSLSREGFALVPHKTAVSDFRSEEGQAAAEAEQLLREQTGADRVVITGKPILRFAERSPLSGALFNSTPARFIHIDVSDPTAEAFALRAEAKPARRFAHYNVWRVLSPPPQDTPLALIDSRSLQQEDLVPADAVFDAPGAEWSFEGLLVRHNPRHRWCYFPDMTCDEALVFKTNDSNLCEPHAIAHSAFDDPSCPAGVEPRASVEIRGIAFWY